MDKGRLVAAGVIVGGGWYFLTRSGALAGTGAGLDDLGLVPHEPTPAERARAEALRQPAPGNAPIAASSSPGFVGAGGLAAIGGGASVVLGAVLGPGIALGIATAGIGIAVAFISYELLKQRASMHTNDVRDAWEKQFVALHTALGLQPLTYAQTAGSAPGTLEMAEVIFLFDHDRNQLLWKAVQNTQDERQFRGAALNVDRFLTYQGVPVQDVV